MSKSIRRLKNIYHLFMAVFANLRYGFPGRKLTVIGVTGTDGKTTTVNLIYHLLKSAGKKVSMISTVKAVIGEKEFPLGFHVTTPNSFTIQKYLREAVEAGSEYFVLETTSHALDQFRVWGITYKIGVLTNITSEHLDYHLTFDKYLAAKMKLLRKTGIVILNADDQSYDKIRQNAKGMIISYGIQHPADIMAVHVRLSAENTVFDVIIPQRILEKFGGEKINIGGKNISLEGEEYVEYHVLSNLVGEFNISNLLAAFGCCISLGLSVSALGEGLKSFFSVDGRMERVETKRGFQIIIDFAHTPGAFQKVLPMVKKITPGRLIHIFGAAGLRDFLKRPEMGEISSRYSNFIILTAEDPRTEDVNQIMNEIAIGVKKAGFHEASKDMAQKDGTGQLVLIADRKEAIQFAIDTIARKGDTVFISGKGHEHSMCYGVQELPWSEREVVQEILDKKNIPNG